MCDNKFYICRHCGNIIGLIYASGVPVVCCGEPMEQLTPNTVETSYEKHLPVVAVNGDTVEVSIGTVAHPMTLEHSIQWVYLQTENGGQRKCLKIGAAPKVRFALSGDRPIAAYAYCNLHGLWLTEF
mgnify:CR=1 FL=1